MLTAHLEAGHGNNHGVQSDITWRKGHLKIANSTSFGNAYNVIEGAQGDAQPMKVLPVPDIYKWVPPSELGASQLELTHLYAAYASDVNTGTRLAPTFADALVMHELIDQMEVSSRSGQRVALK